MAWLLIIYSTNIHGNLDGRIFGHDNTQADCEKSIVMYKKQFPNPNRRYFECRKVVQ